MTPIEQAYDWFILALCVWREARGQSPEAWAAVAWTVRNRASKPGWWGGPSIASVVLKPLQFSSFNPGDPNAVKLPAPNDAIFSQIMITCQDVISGKTPDQSAGATHYYDKSMDSNPPSWAQAMTPTVVIGALRFFK